MPMRLTVSGDHELDAALQLWPVKFRRKAMRIVLRDAMKQIILPDAKRRTPVDKGLLRRSLKVRVGKDKGNKRMPRGVIAYAVVSALTKTIDAYYSGWVFLGHKTRDGKKLEGTRTLRRALYENAAAWWGYVQDRARQVFPEITREVRIESLKYKGNKPGNALLYGASESE